MRIAQIAPLTEAIPPKLYGGTERVISWLTEELVALGHDFLARFFEVLGVVERRVVDACVGEPCSDVVLWAFEPLGAEP